MFNIYKICRLCCFPALKFPLTTLKFYKVVERRYSGEVGNAYITLWQIYSGYYTTNFMGIVQVL